MILSKDRRTVVVTPTKTATFTLEQELKKTGDYEFVTPRHQRELPVGLPSQLRRVILPIRNPYDRLVSMFRWGHSKHHSTLMRLAEGGTFESFCFRWAALFDANNPRNRDWTTTYLMYLQSLRAQTGLEPELFRIEDGVPMIMQALGYEARGYLSNVSHNFEDVTDWWTIAAFKAIGDRVKDDLPLGNYKKPKMAGSSKPHLRR